MDIRQTVKAGPRKRAVSPVSTTIVRIELLKRGWSVQELADRCGLTYSTLRHELAYGFPEQTVRLKVDSVFGQPVFSTLRAFQRRRALAAAIGFDPYLEKKTELQAWATNHGCPFSNRGRIFRKAELIAKIASRLLMPKKDPFPL